MGVDKELPTHFTLNTGAKIPAVGFGTWQAAPHEVERAVEIALKSGYRHIDCAAIYRNEAEVGAGLKNSGVDRKEVFITGKLWNTKHAPSAVEAAVDQTLKDLGTDYLDLYLMHWPCAFKDKGKWFPLDSNGMFELENIDPAETYKSMEKLVASGKVKAIGVSNFNIRRLKDLLSKVSVVPAVNQIEAHPYLQQPELKEFCTSKNILLEAYSPLGHNQSGEPRVIDDEKVKDLGKETGLDVGQLCASWGVQRGTVVLPKSVTKSRIESNKNVSRLADDVYSKLNALEKHKRFNFPARWGFDIFEETGEEAVRKAAVEAGEENKTKFTV